MQFTSSFCSKRFVKVQVVQPYISTDTATSWKYSNLILSKKLNFYMVFNMSKVIHAFRKEKLPLEKGHCH